MTEPRQRIYLVETQKVMRIFYAVKTSERPNGRAQNCIDRKLIPEVTQRYVGEQVVGVEELSEERYLKKFKELNPNPLAYPTTREEILGMISNIEEAPE